MTRPKLPKLAVPAELVGVFRQLLLAAPIRLWALILAGPFMTAYDAWLTWIIWKGRLTAGQLEVLGGLAFAQKGVVAIIIVSLAAVKVEAETKLGRLSIGGDDHDDPPPAIPAAAPAVPLPPPGAE